MKRSLRNFLTGLALLAGLVSPIHAQQPAAPAVAKDVELNVAYDSHGATFWADYNAWFTERYKKEHGATAKIKSSAGNWNKQLHAVRDRQIEADVVALGNGTDLDGLRRRGLLNDNWDLRLPHHSVPFTSPVVIVVPKGNPLQIKDWADLTKPGVKLLSTDPHTSRTGRGGFLAVYGSVRQRAGSNADARAFATKVYAQANVRKAPVEPAPTVAVASTDKPAPAVAAVQQPPLLPSADNEVLLNWEKEARDAVQKSEGKLEIVYPSISLRGEPQVAVIDSHLEKHGTKHAAEAYVKLLFSEEAQALAAKHGYRPVRPVPGNNYQRLEQFSVSDLFRGGLTGQDRLFGTGALFDEIRATAAAPATAKN